MTTTLPPLTAVQQVVYDAIRAHIDEHGWPPTLRELAAATGRSLSTVLHHVRGLEERGRIRRDPHRPRAIALTHPEENR